ncbi:MAG: trypsin-like peptidase domain-containing protein [Candidatus Yanofskybacteria bacterium]|nr:trypsin-like peptidase domain-containing protein [Candidatus Yanofskybacteria bacterium]
MLQKTALLLFLFALLHPPGVSAQDLTRRSESVVGLGQVIIADAPLPESVFRAQKHKIIVQVTLIDRKDPSFRQTSMGTGTIIGAGTILTNRHVLDGAKPVMAGREHTSVFSGLILGETHMAEFPLHLVGVGEAGTYKDFMVLQTGAEIMQRAVQPNTPTNPNPYRILMNNGLKLVDEIRKGERVYITGYSPVYGELKNADGRISGAYVDFINYTFPAEVVAKIEEMPMNRAGKVKKLYRLKDGAEPGFSGGMVLDERGRLIGITFSLSPARNFVYVLSAEDIKNFLRANKVNF